MNINIVLTVSVYYSARRIKKNQGTEYVGIKALSLDSAQVWTPFTNNTPGTGSPIIINDPDDVTNRNYRVRVKLQ